MPGSRNRPPLRKALAFLLKGLLGLTLLCALTLVGAMLWLRTDGAARYVSGIAVQALQTQGLSLEMTSLSGPLPGELRIDNLRLADSRGTLFQAKTVLLRIRLQALLGRTLDIQEILLDSPELFRLPEFPPNTTPREESEGIPALPVDIVLGGLSLKNGMVHAAALAPQAREDAEETASAKADTWRAAPGYPDLLGLELSGSAALRGTALSAALSGSFTDPVGQGAEIDIRLETGVHSFLSSDQDSPAASGKGGQDGDCLHIAIRAHENRRGPLALLLDNPDLPEYRLEFLGDGPVSDWQGRLSLLLADSRPAAAAGTPVSDGGSKAAEAAPASAASIVNSNVTFALRCASGSFWRDLAARPDFSLTVDAAALPGPAAPQALTSLLGDRLTARVDLSGAGDTLTASLALDSPSVGAVLRDLRAAPYSPGQSAPWKRQDGSGPQSGTAISGTFSAAIKAPKAFAAASGGSGAPLPMESLSLEGALSALTSAGFSAAELRGTLGARADGQDYAAGYALEGAWDDQVLTLRSFHLEGLGVRASASGTASFVPEGALEAKLTATLADIAPLLGETGPAAGALSLDVAVSGTLEAPELEFALASPALTLPTGTFSGLDVRASAKAALDGPGKNGQGTLAFVLRNSPGGPITLGGDWKAELDGNAPGAPLHAVLEHFTLRGAGVEAEASLACLLPTAEAAPAEPPALNGSATIRVRDWKPLAALAGTPLSGLPATLDLKLEQASGKQSAWFKASLPALLIREPGASDPTLSIHEVALEAKAANLYAAPALDLSLRTGAGLVGPLRWSSGTGSVKGSGGSDGSGEFMLALHQAMRQTAQEGKNARKQSAAADRLNLRGRYDLGKQEVLVDTLALRDPRSKTGLQLQKPLRITLAEGVAVEGAAIAFQPAGKLNANASFAPGAMRVQASLEALPFSVFKLFSDAALPDGVLAARVDLRAAQGVPQGTFAVQSRISATQSVSGASVATSAATPECFLLDISGNLASSPGQSATASPDARATPGLAWLRGTGSFGSSRKPAGSREGSLTFQLPLRPAANGLPLPDTVAPLAAKIVWNGPVEALWQAVPLPDRYLSGPALFDLSLSGPLSAVKPRLNAYLSGVRYQDVPNGVLISGIDLEARNTDTGDLHALLAAKDGQSGSLAVEASLLGLQSQAEPTLRVRGQLNTFHPLYRDDLNIVVSGIFGVNGPVDAAAVSGDILVDQGELLLAGGFGGSVPVLEVTHRRKDDSDSATPGGKPAAQEMKTPPASGGKTGTLKTRSHTANSAKKDDDLPAQRPGLDVRIRVPREFYIRGSGLDSEWQGELRITGPAAEPSLVGALKPVHGYLELLSRTFVFSGGKITFDGGREINPGLGLVLTYEGPDITARIRTEGTAKKPRLRMESTPPLPEDEVLANVLFGKRTSELSRFEAVQLANSMAQLASGKTLTPDVLAGVRKQTGLDMLRIGSSQGADQRSHSGQSGEGNLQAPSSAAPADSGAGSPTLEAGKYVNDSIYVGVEQGFGDEGTTVRVEVELLPSLTLQGKSSSTASEIGLGWKKDY